MDLKQDSEGYILIEDNDLATVTGQEAIGQDITRSIRVWKREYFRDQSIGIDYSKEIFAKGTPITLIISRYKNVILNVNGVESIRDFQFTNTNRSAIITAEIVTKDGSFPYTTEV